MNTGGPAFPAPKVGIDLFNDEGREIGCRVFPPSQGMSLLDYMAGQALAGMAASSFWAENVQANRPDYMKPVALSAYAMVEAMLAEKARREAVVKESSTTDDCGKVAKLEALNGELVEELEKFTKAIEIFIGDAPEVRSARAILAKAKEVA